MEGPLFGDFIDVFASFRLPLDIVVVDQVQIALALFVVVEELAVIAQQLHKITVAVDGGVQLAQPADQGVRGFGVAGVEFANLGVQQVEEIKGGAGGGFGWRAGGGKAAPLLSLISRHHLPANRLGVGEDTGLDGFVLAGGGHLRDRMGGCHRSHSCSD